MGVAELMKTSCPQWALVQQVTVLVISTVQHLMNNNAHSLVREFLMAPPFRGMAVIFFVQRVLRGSSKKGKEYVYPVVKITTSMFSSTVPSSKTAEVSVNSFTLVLIVTVPQRIQVGSSSFTIFFGFFL